MKKIPETPEQIDSWQGKRKQGAKSCREYWRRLEAARLRFRVFSQIDVSSPQGPHDQPTARASHVRRLTNIRKTSSQESDVPAPTAKIFMLCRPRHLSLNAIGWWRGLAQLTVNGLDTRPVRHAPTAYPTEQGIFTLVFSDYIGRGVLGVLAISGIQP